MIPEGLSAWWSSKIAESSVTYLSVPEMGGEVVALLAELEGDDLMHLVCTKPILQTMLAFYLLLFILGLLSSSEYLNLGLLQLKMVFSLGLCSSSGSSGKRVPPPLFNCIQ